MRLTRRGVAIRGRALPPLVAMVPVLLAAGAGMIGADLLWLVAAGRAVMHGRGVTGVPFAVAPSQHWHNALAGAELLLAGTIDVLGPRGLMLLNVVLVSGGIAALVRQAHRRGAGDRGLFAALLLFSIGGLQWIVVMRAGSFSFLVYPVLLGLLVRESGEASSRIWWAVPLLAVWANLHGGVLVGYLALLVYLLGRRCWQQPLLALVVAMAGALALCATSATIHSPQYYLGLLNNQAARMQKGVWAPLSPHSALAVLLVVSVVPLVMLALRGQMAAWEWILVLLLAVETVRASRTGMFLLLTLVPAAAAGMHGGPRRAVPGGRSAPWFAAVLTLPVLLLHRPAGTPTRMSVEAAHRAAGTAVLAEDLLAEQVAERGGRVWVGNPIDAFSSADQRLYLDWSDGLPSGDAAIVRAQCLILTQTGSRADRRMASRRDLQTVASDKQARMYRKDSCARGPESEVTHTMVPASIMRRGS